MSTENDIEIAHKKLKDSHFIFDSEWFTKEYFKDENDNDFPDRYEKLIHLEKEILQSYEAVVNPSESFWSRLRAFMSASSKAGRGAKAIKDFALLFTPYGRQISTVTEFVSEQFIQSEQNEEQVMATDETIFQKIKRRIKQPSTQSALALIATVLGSTWIGIDVNVEVLTQSAIGIVTGLSGVYAGAIAIYDMFRDEDKRNQ